MENEQEYADKIQELENRITDLNFLVEEYRMHMNESIGRSAYLSKELAMANKNIESLARTNQALQERLTDDAKVS